MSPRARARHSRGQSVGRQCRGSSRAYGRHDAGADEEHHAHDRSLRKERGVNREGFKGRNARAAPWALSVWAMWAGRWRTDLRGRGSTCTCSPMIPTSRRLSSRTRGHLGRARHAPGAERFRTIHCPYNAETRGMIGQRELTLMPRDAFLITTARGGIVEEGALVEPPGNRADRRGRGRCLGCRATASGAPAPDLRL